MKQLYMLTVAMVLAGCGGGGGSNSSPPPPANQSVGGIWEGVDSDGDNIVGLIAESGFFHFIDDFGQGFGIAAVSNGNQVDASYTYVADLGTVLFDGSTSADCTLSGTIVERQTLTVASNCTTTLGSTTQVTASLTYDSLYERNASLATIAGQYSDFGDVITIDNTGAVFEQSATTGCVLNGQVSVINPEHNAYGVAFTVGGCGAGFTELNGTSWSGIGALDNSDSSTPEELVFGVTGDVTISGVTATFALIIVAPRI